MCVRKRGERDVSSKLAVVVHLFDPNGWKAEANGSLSLQEF